MLVPMSRERFVQRMMYDALKAEEKRLTAAAVRGYFSAKRTRRLRIQANKTSRRHRR